MIDRMLTKMIKKNTSQNKKWSKE